MLFLPGGFSFSHSHVYVYFPRLSIDHKEPTHTFIFLVCTLAGGVVFQVSLEDHFSIISHYLPLQHSAYCIALQHTGQIAQKLGHLPIGLSKGSNAVLMDFLRYQPQRLKMTVETMINKVCLLDGIRQRCPSPISRAARHRLLSSDVFERLTADPAYLVSIVERVVQVCLCT